MGSKLLDSIILTPLQRIPANGGDVLKVLTKEDPGFVAFGEAYISIVNPGAVKGWKRHREMTLNLVVPSGKVRVVFYDQTETRVPVFRIEEIGIDRYARITVPPKIWFGFQGIDTEPSLLLNIASIVHDPNESDRLDLSDITFNWQNI